MQNHLNGHRKKQNHKKRGKRESRTVGLLGWTARDISTVCFSCKIVTPSEREERRRRRKTRYLGMGWSGDRFHRTAERRGDIRARSHQRDPRDDLFIVLLIIMIMINQSRVALRQARRGGSLKLKRNFIFILFNLWLLLFL